MKDIVFSKTDKIKIITFIVVAYGLPWLFFPWVQAGEKMFVLLVLMRMLHVVGLSVFFGWAYMKTKNIWLCVLLHGFQNAATLVFEWVTGGGTTGNIGSFDYIMIFISAVIMLLFLFSKEYN